MELLFTCLYCNKKWIRNVYSGESMNDKCDRCGDINISVKELNKTKIDGYVGCPPFPDRYMDKNKPYWDKKG